MRRPAFALLLVCLLITACGRSTRGKYGAELYEISCDGCHGSRGEGSVIGPPIGTPDSNAALVLRDDQIFGAIRVGPGAMPGNPYLTDDQITSLVAFLRELQRPPDAEP